MKSKGTKRLPPARSLPGASLSSPGKILAGAGSSCPGKTFAAAIRPTPMERITLESTAPMGRGFGRYPRGGMQIFVKTFQIRCKIRRRRPLAGFRPRRSTRPHSKRHGKTLVGAPARPLPRTPTGPLSGRHQLGFHRPTQLPTQPAGQAPAWRPTDLHGGPLLRHLSCLSAYMAPQAPLVRSRVNTRRGGDGQDGRLPSSPIKQVHLS